MPTLATGTLSLLFIITYLAVHATLQDLRRHIIHCPYDGSQHVSSSHAVSCHTKVDNLERQAVLVVG